MASLLAWLKSNIVEILAIWGGLQIVISGIVKLTPTKKDDEMWAKAIAAINKLLTIGTSKKK